MTNKRIIAILSAIIVIVGVFAACNQHTKTQTEITTQVAVTEVAVTLSEATTVPETVAEPTESDTTTSETNPVRAETTADRETTSQRATTTTTQRTTAKETTTNKPTTTKKSEATTKKKETTTAKKTTTTTTTTQKSLDIGSYVSFAKNYGIGIGLNFDSSVTECWDNPITVTFTNGESVKRDIKSRLNRYKNVEDFTEFNVWYEKRNDGKYDLYISYN